MTQPSDNPALRVLMVQDGARRRYALPAALEQAGALAAMYTDWFDQPGTLLHLLTRLLSHCGDAGRRLTGRTHPALQHAHVRTNPRLTLRHHRGAQRFAQQADYYQWAARNIGAWIARENFANANVLLGFIRNLDPALLTAAQQRGLITVGDQIIAPAAVEIAAARAQQERWPGWEADVEASQLRPFVDWEQQTWAALDHIICMSDYVRAGLHSQGVAADKITVIPYPIDARAFRVADRANRTGPVTIGFVGAVNLRKGAPDFLQVASRFDPQQVRFVMVGENHLNPEKLNAHRGHVELVGKVPRAQVADWLDRFDIFFFPTTCEGSAGSVMEAMCCGLPVVTTPSAGSVIEHAKNGLLCPVGDHDAMTAALQALIHQPKQRLQLGHAARQRAEQFTLAAYQSQLIALLERLLQERR